MAKNTQRDLVVEGLGHVVDLHANPTRAILNDEGEGRVQCSLAKKAFA